VETVRNPVRLARAVMEESAHVMMISAGAEQFADTQPQIERVENTWFDTDTRRAQLDQEQARERGVAGEEGLRGKYFGTVGAVALDSQGHLAAATSTGGRGMEWPGRVSDSPTVAGNYANEIVGLSATGIGEQIVDFALCAKVATRCEDGMSLKAAMQKSFKDARARKYHFGAIALNRRGEYAAATTTPRGRTA
jgi:beta-aspartyl-peptidase (threonine type)